MSAVYLQPAADADSRKNLARTFFQDVDRAPVIQSITRGEARVHEGLIADLPSELAAWGTRVRNRAKWQAMRVGDTVVFFGNGEVFATAQVVMTVESRELGRAYWSDDQWSLVFYLSRVVSREVPLKALRGHGIAENRVLNTLTRFDSTDATQLRAAIGAADAANHLQDVAIPPGLSYVELAFSRALNSHRATAAQRVEVSRYPRDVRVRLAVLIRSAGKCEGIDCAGMPSGTTRAGHPYLDVDHAMDLALGGNDDPANAVALCPNCHAVKTRGPDFVSLRKQYVERAKVLHDAAIANDS